MISFKDKYIFTHVPRTAGTSIEYALREISSPENLTGRDPEDPMSFLTAQHVRLPKLINMAAEVNIDISDYFKFTFTRNPWDRLVSYYYYDHLSSRLQTGADSKYMEFDEWVARELGPNSRGYLSEGTLFCTYPGYETKEILSDYIGRFENLQDDFDNICDRLKIPRSQLTVQRATNDIETCPWHVQNNFKVYKREIPVSDHYTTAMVERLRPYFSVEIDLLGYPDVP